MQRSCSITDIWQVLLFVLGSAHCGRNTASVSFLENVRGAVEQLSDLVRGAVQATARRLASIFEMKNFWIESYYQTFNSAGSPGLLRVPIARTCKLVGVAWSMDMYATTNNPNAFAYLQLTQDINEVGDVGVQAISVCRCRAHATLQPTNSQNIFIPNRWSLHAGQNLWFVVYSGTDSTLSCLMQLHLEA